MATTMQGPRQGRQYRPAVPVDKHRGRDPVAEAFAGMRDSTSGAQHQRLLRLRREFREWAEVCVAVQRPDRLEAEILHLQAIAHQPMLAHELVLAAAIPADIWQEHAEADADEGIARELLHLDRLSEAAYERKLRAEVQSKLRKLALLAARRLARGGV